MKRIALASLLSLVFIVSKAQQQKDPVESKAVPGPPSIMTKNDKPVGYNDDPHIFSLARQYKSIKTSNTAEDPVLKDFNSWWAYTARNVNLSQDFQAFATDSKTLSKRIFLQLLTTGEFYVVKNESSSGLPAYQLVNLTSSNKDIQNTVIQLAGDELTYYNMEGKELPAYHFQDIAGHQYDNKNTRGKIIVLKCWFIHCVACVKEFPALNQLVDDYKNRKDILFVSLAFDNSQELKAFLKSRQFNYEVVPDQESYMMEKLGIGTFPTHIVIGKDGKIIKVVTNCDNLVPALRKAALIPVPGA